MRYSDLFTKFTAMLLVCVNLIAVGAHAEERLNIGGTGGDLGTMKMVGVFFEQENPGVTVNVLSSLGSSGGIKALAGGAIDLAISSRPLNDREKTLGLKDVPYSITAMVIVTGKPNMIKNVSRDDLAKMFDGRIKTWPDGTPIRIVLRPALDSDTKLIKTSIPELATSLHIASKVRGVATGMTDQETADYLEKIPGSLGLLSLSVVKGERRPLSIIALDGVHPSAETIKSGAYPSLKTFYFVSRASGSNVAKKFIDFVGSEMAQAVMKETGHIVILGNQ